MDHSAALVKSTHDLTAVAASCTMSPVSRSTYYEGDDIMVAYDEAVAAWDAFYVAWDYYRQDLETASEIAAEAGMSHLAAGGAHDCVGLAMRLAVGAYPDPVSPQEPAFPDPRYPLCSADAAEDDCPF